MSSCSRAAIPSSPCACANCSKDALSTGRYGGSRGPALPPPSAAGALAATATAAASSRDAPAPAAAAAAISAALDATLAARRAAMHRNQAPKSYNRPSSSCGGPVHVAATADSSIPRSCSSSSSSTTTGATWAGRPRHRRSTSMTPAPGGGGSSSVMAYDRLTAAAAAAAPPPAPAAVAPVTSCGSEVSALSSTQRAASDGVVSSWTT
jgi:hypothetical protein